MMKRKEPEKGRLEQIPRDLKKKKKMSVTHHQKEQVKSPRGGGKKLVVPFDLEEEIMSRLPGKSLMRFLCVSKTWSSLIRSQRFVASYYAKKPSRFIVAFSNSVFGDPKRLFILTGEEEETSCSSSEDSLVANLDMTIPGVTIAHGPFQYSSVHGYLVCFQLSKFIICNPSTGQVIRFHAKTQLTSLGYDPVDDQFKALTQVSCLLHSNLSSMTSMVHEVIRLGRRRGGGGGGVVSRRQFTSPPYYPLTLGRSINGFMYYAAWAPSQEEGETPVFVCFDVRNEKILSFISAPKEVLASEAYTRLIEYKGKLAVIAGNYGSSFDLWTLEDVTKHEWSKQTFELPLSEALISQGTNKAGEIVFSPSSLPGPAQPFYVFHFNPDTKSTRRVRIHGVADTQEFWTRYGLSATDPCCAVFSPQHADTIAFL
ncbi:unnamed protein product [Eruca vesicaria subsp. sativa]|uniref:F-box domain-containing protein n=1 Tax=Eruca vesicaria subsp. sativa TaxID=29727 RepID=A0ABC8K213_ERUVS|nr:unnamed protein product [Eruca vesicaria subsp. sativa]